MTELIVILVIMGLLFAIAVPMIVAYTPSYNLKQATRDLVSQMQLARIHAIRNGVRTVAVFDPKPFNPAGQAGTYMVFRDTNGNWTRDVGEPMVLDIVTMPSRVTLISANFTNNGTDTLRFGFDPKGVGAITGGTYVTGSVQLRNSKNSTRTITFYAPGKVKATNP